MHLPHKTRLSQVSPLMSRLNFKSQTSKTVGVAPSCSNFRWPACGKDVNRCWCACASVLFNIKYFPFKGQDKRSKHLYQLVTYLRAVSLCLTFCTNPRHIQGGILSHLQQVLLFLRLIKLTVLCDENEANRQSSCHSLSLAAIVTVTAIVCCIPRLWL